MTRRDSLVTPAEREFLAVLERAVATHAGASRPAPFRVCVQIPIICLVDLRASPHRQVWSNKIDRKRADFVLVDSQSLKPMLVIELDDKSHERADRKERDQTFELVLRTAGVPLLRVPVARHGAYSISAISESVHRALAEDGSFTSPAR